MKYILFVGLGVFLSACGDNSWKDPDEHLEKSGLYCYPTLGGG